MKHIVIDVREPDEYASSHVSSAINVPLSQLSTSDIALRDLSKDDTHITVYCRTGRRAAAARDALQRYGFKSVSNGISQSHVEAHYDPPR